MSGLRPGDVVTDEPTAVGTVLADMDGDTWSVGADRKWRCGNPASTWDELRERNYGKTMTLVSIPEPVPAPVGDAAAELEALADEVIEFGAAGLDARVLRRKVESMLRTRAAELRAATLAPAEEWEPVTAELVRVGDHIEITREWDGGRILMTGVVTEIHGGTVRLGANAVYLGGSSGVVTETIRRRVRQPMPEPDAPAVTLDTSGDVSPLGEPARPGHCQVLIGDGYCPTPATWDVDFLCPDGTMRTGRTCTRHASHARMVGGCVCALHNREHITSVACTTLRGES